MQSLFHLFSLGIVLETKKPEEWMIKVYPVEHIPLRDGELNVENTDTITTVTLSGETVSEEVKEENAIYAMWLPEGNSNRVTPPDVVANETVRIFRYADTDRFYWAPLGFETTLRQLEHVSWAFCNTPDFKQEIDKDKTYHVIVSTRDKHIKVHTSDNDGEHTTYDLTVDTKNGTVELIDGKDNSVRLDSASDRLTITTNVDVVIDTPDTYIKGNLWVDGNTDVKGDTMLHSTLTVDGNTNLKSSLNVGGSTSIGGSLTVSGSGRFGGAVKAAGHI